MAKCPQCGGSDLRIMSLEGALEKIKCMNCGHEELVHTHHESVYEDPLKNERVVHMTLDLDKSVSSSQLAELRTIFRKFELMTPLELKKASLARDTIEIGSFPSSEAQTLKKKVSDLGLENKLKLRT